MRKDKLLSLLADTDTFGKSWSQISFGGRTLGIGEIGLIHILQMPFVKQGVHADHQHCHALMSLHYS